MFAIGFDRITRLDRWDNIIEQILFENGKSRCCGHHVSFGPVVLLRAAIGHHDNHWYSFAIGDQIVKKHVWGRKSLPFCFIPTDPVQQIQHRVLFVLGVARRSIDV